MDADCLINCALDTIRRAKDGLDNPSYAKNQLSRAIDYLTRAAAAIPDVVLTEEGRQS